MGEGIIEDILIFVHINQLGLSRRFEDVDLG